MDGGRCLALGAAIFKNVVRMMQLMWITPRRTRPKRRFPQDAKTSFATKAEITEWLKRVLREGEHD